MTPNVALPALPDLEALLSEDERQVHDVVARFVDKQVLPTITMCFEEQRFPRELAPAMAELGLLGPALAEYGCLGLRYVAYGLIMQELERGDSGLRSFASVQSGLVMYPIHEYGCEAQNQRWLPALANAQGVGCFGLTEPDGGSDPGNMKTRAQRDGGDWVLNGAETWITNGTIADVAVVQVSTDDGIRSFWVERGAPGYTARDIKHQFSLRASITSELFLDNCRVPDANRLPGAEGLVAAVRCLTQARYGIAWGALGTAQACYREALAFARERVLFKQPLVRKQGTQVRLASRPPGGRPSSARSTKNELRQKTVDQRCTSGNMVSATAAGR